MRFSTTTILATAIALSASSADAFTAPGSAFGVRQSGVVPARLAPLRSTPADSDDEVKRLQKMAAKLREEAASLEARQQEERAQAADKAFRKFDTNGDGEISLEELKAALEKTFKMDVPDDRMQRLMETYDRNGDGKLQPAEFVGVEQFRNRLAQLAADERKLVLDEQKAAQVAKQESEFTEMMEAQLDMINDRPPTGTDKIVSILPYLFPLLDGLRYGQFLMAGQDDNPVVIALAVLYTLYRTVPFSGFICFFGLSALGNNPAINRLTRFNSQQAISLDIALIIPTFFGAILSFAGVDLPVVLTVLGSDAIFLVTLAVVGYATVSSLLGVTPDKVPFISENVGNRMLPTADELEFDVSTGQFKKKEDEKKDE